MTVTVTTARTELKLVSLDALKTELQITAADTDDYLSALLDRVSEEVESYCDRVFAVETVLESVRVPWGSTQIFLSRHPVTVIASVTDGADVVDVTDYELNASAGTLLRLSDSSPVAWGASNIEIAYTGGFAVIPGPIQQAIFELVKLNQAARTRDPSLQSENFLEGLYSYRMFDPSGMKDGMPPHVASMLSRYVKFSV